MLKSLFTFVEKICILIFCLSCNLKVKSSLLADYHRKYKTNINQYLSHWVPVLVGLPTAETNQLSYRTTESLYFLGWLVHQRM